MKENGCTPNNEILHGLGHIKVELRRAKLTNPSAGTNDARLTCLYRQPYDEEKVKLKLAHVANLEPKQEVEPTKRTWDLLLHPQDDESPFYSFLFKHNSEAVWRASGHLRRKRRKH
jgi:hypothetical protein